MAYREEVLADAPAGYWPLGDASGNPQDASGNARHVTVVGGTPIYGVPGPVSGTTAVTFDGTTEYFTSPDGAWFDLGDVFTLEAWVTRPSAISTIVAKGTNGYELGILDVGDNLVAWCLELRKANIAEIVESNVGIPATGWHHVVATKNGATVKLYIDGVDVTGTVTNATFANTADAVSYTHLTLPTKA